MADAVRTPDPLIDLADELVARSEARGLRCVDLSEISEVVQASELDEDEVQTLQIAGCRPGMRHPLGQRLLSSPLEAWAQRN